jgi:hypothetical protein
MTTYSEIYSRLAKEDLELRAARREQVKQLYEGVMNSVVRPASKGIWEATKYLGRGIKKAAIGTAKAGHYAASVYSDYQSYLDAEEKVKGITREQRAAAQATLDQKVDEAKTELRIASQAATKASEEFKKDPSQEAVAKAAYNLEQEKILAYKTAKRAAGGFWERYVLKPIAGARTYQEAKTIAERVNANGFEVSPLQIYAVLAGYASKFDDKEFKKPKDEKKPKFEAPIYNPFTGEPIKTKVKEKVKDPATGAESEVEVEKEAKAGFDKLGDWMEYILAMARIGFMREEQKQRGEQMRNNPFAGMNFGFPPGFNPWAFGFNPGFPPGYGFAGHGAGYNPGTGPRNP